MSLNITLWFAETLLTLTEDSKAFVKLQMRVYAEEHKQERKAYHTNYAKINSHRILARVVSWTKDNPEKARINRRAYHHRNRDNVNYRIRKNLRTRQWFALKAVKCASRNVEARLGCSVCEFKQHIEHQLKEGWTWDNWGSVWEIDHIKPCVKFDLTDPEQEKACFHFSNQRPLALSENRSKGGK